MTLAIPSFNNTSLKFISKPQGLFANFKYVPNCFLNSSVNFVTDFSSKTTPFSTSKSILRAPSVIFFQEQFLSNVGRPFQEVLVQVPYELQSQLL